MSGDPTVVRPPLLLSSPSLGGVAASIYTSPPPLLPPFQPEYPRRACPRLFTYSRAFSSFLPPKFLIPPGRDPPRCRCLKPYLPRCLPPYTRQKTAAPAGDRTLQDQFEAQTVRLQEIHKAQRPKNTTKTYEPKQKEWEDWCARLRGNTDGSRVTEDKLCLFLEQEVVNRESRAPGYQARRTKRKKVWKDGERAKKKQKTAAAAAAAAAADEDQNEDEEWDEDALDALFNETVRYSLVNSYASAITELHAWQQSQASADDKTPPLRGAKLTAILDSVRRDEDKNQRANYVDRGLFTIAGGYDVQALKNAIAWCWETGSKTPGSVESYLRTAAEHLLGLHLFVLLRNPSYDVEAGTDLPSSGYATVTRGESKRDVQLADLIVIDLENEGPKPGESAPYIIMTMR
jgi:hypothetical protein